METKTWYFLFKITILNFEMKYIFHSQLRKVNFRGILINQMNFLDTISKFLKYNYRMKWKRELI